MCEVSVRSQPDVLKKEHVSIVRRNELRFPGTVPCEADLQMAPWALLRGASFSWGDQTEMSDTDCSALVPKCTSDILFTGVKQKELIR